MELHFLEELFEIMETPEAVFDRELLQRIIGTINLKKMFTEYIRKFVTTHDTKYIVIKSNKGNYAKTSDGASLLFLTR